MRLRGEYMYTNVPRELTRKRHAPNVPCQIKAANLTMEPNRSSHTHVKKIVAAATEVLVRVG